MMKTNRLTLRLWNETDLIDLHEIISNKKITNLAGFHARCDLEETMRILNIFINENPHSL